MGRNFSSAGLETLASTSGFHLEGLLTVLPVILPW